MIGVSLRPSSSSAARIAPTRPSIMSLGAMTSAPACAWLSAVRASRSTDASLSTLPSARSRPQWPWLVYSQRHRSAMTSRSGWASLIARVASWTTPSSSQAPEPSSSLAAGMPNSSTPGSPSAAASPASATAWEIDSRSTPGIACTGARPSRPSSTNSGSTRALASRRVSRTRSRSTGVRRSRRRRVCGKATASHGSPARCRSSAQNAARREWTTDPAEPRSEVYGHCGEGPKGLREGWIATWSQLLGREFCCPSVLLGRVAARRPCLRLAAAALAAVAALVSGLGAARPAHAALSAVGPVNPATAFPDWYQDGTGLKLQLCLDGPPFCLAAANELVAPDGEAFWFQAEAVVPVGPGGTARLVLAQEAAFLDTAPISFGRVRVVVTSAQPNTTYTFEHPYGTATVTTDVGGNGRFGQDVGCEAAPCAFGAALGSGVGPEFLRWDPSVPPAPPGGHIGDALTPHAVVGGSVRNTFGVAGGASTSLFTVQGKLAGPPVPVFNAPGTVDFGTQTKGVPSSRAVVVRSFGVPDGGTGRSNLVIAGIGLSGPAASDYQIVSNTCSAQSLASGAGCTLGIQFTPSAAGARSARIDLGTNAAGSVRHVALAGNGALSAAEVAAAAARRLTVRRLRTTHRMSRARVLRRGLRLSMRVPAGAEILKIAVYRVRGGRAIRKPVWLGFRAVNRTGLYRMRLNSRALRRRLKTGLYQVNVTPGVSRRELGRTTTTRIRITRR